MFGIGATELIVLGLFCLLPVIAGCVGIGFLIWYVVKNNGKSSTQENEP